MMNNTATTEVTFDKIPSIVLPLFLPKNVSAPPAIAPDIPCVLPDCIKTITIKTKATIISMIVRAVFTINTSKPNREILTYIVLFVNCFLIYITLLGSGYPYIFGSEFFF